MKTASQQNNTIKATVICVDRNGNNDTRLVDTNELQSFIRKLHAKGGSIEHIKVPAGTPQDVRISLERIGQCSLTLNLGI